MVNGNLNAWIGERLEGQAEAIRQLGGLAASAAKNAMERDKRTFKTQLSRLERVALQAQSFVEIRAYIKRQIGKGSNIEDKLWGQGREDSFGESALKLLGDLEMSLPGDAEERKQMLRERVVERLAGTAFRHVNSEFLYQLVSS